LQLARSLPADLILLDIQLPPGADGPASGLDMLETLRADPALADIPVLIVTSDSRMSRESAVRSGSAGFFLKPFKPAALREQVRAFLDERSRARLQGSLN
jgi:CheY-like chemotaxis protein